MYLLKGKTSVDLVEFNSQSECGDDYIFGSVAVSCG